jgi:hypothetical protein
MKLPKKWTGKQTRAKNYEQKIKQKLFDLYPLPFLWANFQRKLGKYNRELVKPSRFM